MFYRPVQANRMFSKTVRYVDIDWFDLDTVVTAFETRIGSWYFKPADELAQLPGGHYAFSIMAIDCLLIDTFSQFATGMLESRQGIFKQFVRDNLPNFSAQLSYPIDHLDHRRNGPKQLKRLEEVLYHGFRCGILHEAHIPLYGSIDPSGPHFRETPSGLATYASTGADCPNVTINPLLLLGDLKSYFASYVVRLKSTDTQDEPLRKKFKVKFSDSFGVSV